LRGVRPKAAAKTIGERLKRLRLERGLSRRELAVEGGQPGVLETGSELDEREARELRLADAELALRLAAAADR